MSTALRELLASFVIEVDKAGELAKGNAAVDALKSRLGELQAEFAKVKAPAARAAGAVQDVFARAAQTAQRNVQAIAAQQLGGRSNTDGFLAAGLGAGRVAQFGPTRETLNAARAATAQAEAAAARYAQTLRGRLGTAVQAVRDGFRGGGSAGGGAGLLDALTSARAGLVALGAGAAVAGVKRLVDGIGDINEGAQRLGVSTDDFQRLSALAKVNATDVGTLGTAFRTLANSAVDPTEETTSAFARLGVATKDATGQFKSSQELFFDVGEALAAVANETERSQLAQKLLGRSAQELKPLFAQGTEAFRQQRLEMLKLRVLSKETIDAADSASDSWALLGTQLLAASEPLLKLLIPALKTLTEWLSKGVEVIGKFLAQTDLVALAFTALAGVVSFKLIPGFVKLLPLLKALVTLGGGWTKVLGGMAGSAAKAALSFARLVIPLLLLEDIITFFRGGDTLTGRFLDSIFGDGTAEGVQKTIGDVTEAFKDLWRWIFGNGAGDKAKALYAELAEGIRLIINDLLAEFGLREKGLAGLRKAQTEGSALSGTLSVLRNAPVIGGVAGLAADILNPGTMAAPGAAPGQYGPPAPPGAVSFGDTNVTVNMGPSATPGDVGRAVVSAQTEDRNRLVAAHGGI